jgi:hypothetical protein
MKNRNGFFPKYLVALMIFFLPEVMHAQVNIMFNANAFGNNIRGLSSVQFINNSPNVYTGTLTIDVKNLMNNSVILHAIVTGVVIKPGNNVIPQSRFSSSPFNYAATNDGNYLRQTGNFPETELEFCFRIDATLKDNNAEVFENCFISSNLLASPMQLLQPDMGDQFCNKRPSFTWQPPMPMNPNMKFTLKVAEIHDKQSAAEAILNNSPVIFQQNIKGYMVMYPAGSPDLKEEKKYAWQVIATVNDRLTLSEVWEFGIQCDKQKIDTPSFRLLKDEDDGGYLQTGSMLRFAVYNSLIKGKLQYEIIDLTSSKRPFKKLPEFELQNGSNNIMIDLNKIPGMQYDNEYELKVLLPGGKKVALRFKYDDQHD